MIFKKKGTVPAEVTNGFETIALRMPDNAFVLSVINGVGVTLLVPSANITTQPPALNYQEVLDQLDGRIDGVVIGTCRNNISSTILNTLEPELTIVREGPISLEAIKMSLKETANG
ncbi:Threonylcarbamoyl-AMP synthase [bioreactor metagenome]|uniref:L-threonylcarbamoyladenylate synthase n=1 Tax=bioreactor metagenome TaxID=1076179 RepID=A0A645A128_9ZZZZ